ncbi:MAG: 3-hydroxyacyl-CoA dehydrogenase NAD-binding domain-containing protein [Bilophila wadsworthia]
MLFGTWSFSGRYDGPCHCVAVRARRTCRHLTDVDRDALDRAERSIRRLAGTQSSNLGEAPGSVMARLRFAEDGFRAAAGAELVVEVISERVDIKRRFYEELAGVVSPSALIASNTSVLDIFEHAPSVPHPQLIMAHYFVPAHIIPLVEIVAILPIPDSSSRNSPPACPHWA